MAAPIVAAAGGLLVEKASDENSIVNTAFKYFIHVFGLDIAIPHILRVNHQGCTQFTNVQTARFV